MKKFIIFLFVLTYPALLLPQSVDYNEFKPGDSKDRIISIIKQQYSKNEVYYENNDRIIGDLVARTENSIKIIVRGFKNEDILLVFDAKNFLTDVYRRLKVNDLRDYIRLKTDFIKLYGQPIEQTIEGKIVTYWILIKENRLLYLIYNENKRELTYNLQKTN